MGSPKNKSDRDMLMFSDQGAWFAFSLPVDNFNSGGFSGPFLMTQQNGVWLSSALAKFELSTDVPGTSINWKIHRISQRSYASHLEQTFGNDSIKIAQQLVFLSGHTAIQRTLITNTSSKAITINTNFKGELFDVGVTVSKHDNGLIFSSDKSPAVGYLRVVNEEGNIFVLDSTGYSINNPAVLLHPNESKEYVVAQTFIFPEYSMEKEKKAIASFNFDSVLEARKYEKENQLSALIGQSKDEFKAKKYYKLLSKALLTLQNNWRIPAGELKHQGLFPSYHYEWFHGFWSWDSWKHAVGLSIYDQELAKDQIRAMFDYQTDNGFVLDCIYRDTTIEAHNYRDTKPPLAAWAVVKVLEKNEDPKFLREMYPKLIKYHYWWYNNRDHDKDGLCEFGSTDGTILAAKWESGMDNAIRFDNAAILKNSEDAYSLNQESVDLNAYLYAEKLYLASLAEAMEKIDDARTLKSEAAILKKQIQEQFYDSEDGWFYDTNIEGTNFIKGAGSEAWTPLWAKAATEEQAEKVKEKMMDPQKFYSKVPFQTMSKDHPKFDPLNGYWRGPNWLDQAYFGIQGLRNYGYNEEADSATIKLLEGANGILDKGTPIRENYHPITGEGLYAKNFSWSAAHIIMMLTKD